MLIQAFTSQKEVGTGNSRFPDDEAITEYPYDAGVGSKHPHRFSMYRSNESSPREDLEGMIFMMK
jgi:hypothetical protein